MPKADGWPLTKRLLERCLEETKKDETFKPLSREQITNAFQIFRHVAREFLEEEGLYAMKEMLLFGTPRGGVTVTEQMQRTRVSAEAKFTGDWEEVNEDRRHEPRDVF